MKSVAYVCVHNSCRSQIAQALTKEFGGDVLVALSAGTELKDRMNPDAVRLMKKVYGIDMEESQFPKLIDHLPEVDYLYTMGCNVSCPGLPYRLERDDWGLEDPSGKSDECFLAVIKEIEGKVKELIAKVKGAQGD